MEDYVGCLRSKHSPHQGRNSWQLYMPARRACSVEVVSVDMLDTISHSGPSLFCLLPPCPDLEFQPLLTANCSWLDTLPKPGARHGCSWCPAQIPLHSAPSPSCCECWLLAAHSCPLLLNCFAKNCLRNYALLGGSR